RAGQDRFGWQMFADLRNADWHYHSFDPVAAEQVPFDQLVSRYREVTPPEGMEDWHAADFSPLRARWDKAKSPFGNYNGEIPTSPITKCSAGCTGPGCYGNTKINTLWEKEVLLMHGTFQVPPLKDGHRYRLRVNTGEHVGAGGGHKIYINGKQLIEAKQGGGRGSGGRPKGAYITSEFIDDFKTGQVTIAVQTFIRYNAKYSTKPSSKTPQGKFSLHLEQQKLPPMGDHLVTASARVVPMQSSAWQTNLDPEDASQDPDEFLFRWDGNFVANPDVTGTWHLVTEVADIANFDPEQKPASARNPLFSTINFKNGGSTADPTWVWSGNSLMDLNNYQALQMVPKKLGDTPYLFVESGGFSTRNKPGWKPKWYVLQRR
ncbi:MAG: hypothetical protein P8J87_13750, partial [Verrucomicrobiales bacterium]|nr:hypothetical protein [Verrucomicrobiales bacterium]